VLLLVALGTGDFGRFDLDALVGPVFAAAAVVGTLLTFGLYLMAWLARVVTSLWLGRRLLAMAGQGAEGGRAPALLVGVLAYALLMSIPLVGGLLDLLGVALGLGALVRELARRWPRAEPPAAAMPAPVAVGWRQTDSNAGGRANVIPLESGTSGAASGSR
jgi:hypothetical protein